MAVVGERSTRPLVRDGAGVAFIDFVAVFAGDIRRGHRADAVLLDNAGRGAAWQVTQSLVLLARASVRTSGIARLVVGERHHQQDQAEDDDHADQSDDQTRPAVSHPRPLLGLLRGELLRYSLIKSPFTVSDKSRHSA